MVAVKVGPATLIGAGALLILGSLLPWATISAGLISASKNGTSGDGVLTLICGALIVGLGVWLLRSELPMGWLIAGVVVQLVALGTAVYDMANLPSPGNYGAGSFTITIGVDIGIGLWLCLIASLIGLGAIGFIIFGRGKEAELDTQASPPEPAA